MFCWSARPAESCLLVAASTTESVFTIASLPPAGRCWAPQRAWCELEPASSPLLLALVDVARPAVLERRRRRRCVGRLGAVRLGREAGDRGEGGHRRLLPHQLAETALAVGRDQGVGARAGREIGAEVGGGRGAGVVPEGFQIGHWNLMR